MASKYEKMNLLKNRPFYSEEIESPEKNNEKIGNKSFYLNYHFLIKNLKN